MAYTYIYETANPAYLVSDLMAVNDVIAEW